MDPKLDLAYAEPHTTHEANATIEGLLDDAIRRRAEAIYFISTPTAFALKLREGGVLRRVHLFPAESRAMIARAIQSLVISEPMDYDEEEEETPWGRFQRSVEGVPVDLRVTTVPTRHGFDVGITISYDRHIRYHLDELLPDPSQRQQVRDAVRQPYGFSIVTGPPFSGTEVLLMAMLHELNPEEKHLMAIETAIDHTLPGITQVEVNSNSNPDYCDALEAAQLNRADGVALDDIPDDVVLGEVLRSVRQGRHVMATLGLNDVAETIAHLRDMIDTPRVLLRMLSLVVAQRTLPLLHPMNREEIAVPEDMSQHPAILRHKPKHLYKTAKGELVNAEETDQTVTIYEVVPVTDELRQFLKANDDEDALRCALRDLVPGYRSLREQALELAAMGEIALETALNGTPAEGQPSEEDESE